MKCNKMVVAGFIALAVAITVQAKAESPKLEAREITLEEGQSCDLRVQNGKVSEWESSSLTVAYVTDDGEVVANTPGTTMVSAKVGKNTLKCKVKVTPKTEVEVKTQYNGIPGVEDVKFALFVDKTDNTISECSSDATISECSSDAIILERGDAVKYVAELDTSNFSNTPEEFMIMEDYNQFLCFKGFRIYQKTADGTWADASSEWKYKKGLDLHATNDSNLVMIRNAICYTGNAKEFCRKVFRFEIEYGCDFSKMWNDDYLASYRGKLYATWKANLWYACKATDASKVEFYSLDRLNDEQPKIYYPLIKKEIM